MSTSYTYQVQGDDTSEFLTKIFIFCYTEYTIDEGDGSVFSMEVAFDLGSAGCLPAYSETLDLCKKMRCPVAAGDEFKLTFM